jgi:exopolysaccharide/PEP-CTERM locus tyrosine autokinase
LGKVFKALNKVQQADEPEVIKSSTEIDKLHEQTSHGNKAAPQQSAKTVKTVNNLFEKTTETDTALQKVDERLIAFTESSSPVAESFRRLRNRILHPPQGEPARSILVTSVLPEEGKSFICANLAIIMAQSMEQHALMVEGDLRRPSLANLFGLNNDRGLVNFLQDGHDISNLIKDTGFKKLSIIPSGPPPINPAELLDSKKMSAIIEELVRRHPDRFILIDSPPMTAASEIAVLSKYVDGVILVVRYGKSRREHVKEIADMIGKEKIIGVVFNAFEMSKLQTPLQTTYQYYYKNNYDTYQQK